MSTGEVFNAIIHDSSDFPEMPHLKIHIYICTYMYLHTYLSIYHSIKCINGKRTVFKTWFLVDVRTPCQEEGCKSTMAIVVEEATFLNIVQTSGSSTNIMWLSSLCSCTTIVYVHMTKENWSGAFCWKTNLIYQIVGFDLGNYCS